MNDTSLTAQEAKQLQQQVEKQQQLISRANKELESFTYSVSHDLHGPLTIMNGFIDILLRDYKEDLDERGLRLLSRVQSNADYLSESIDGLLVLSRLTNVELSFDEIDVTAMVSEIAQQLQQTNPQRVVNFVFAEGMKVRTDADMLQKIMQELLGNAWKFTCYQSPAIIQLSQINQTEQWVLQIKDNGLGFDMAFIEQLFMPLRRLHSLDEFSGKGLGLAQVHKMVQRLGGEISAESTLGKGCCFQLSLPLVASR